MGKQYDISKSKEGIREISKNLETKKGEISKLEEQKRELMDAITDVSGTSIDEKTKQVIEDSLKTSLEANQQKGLEISELMNSDLEKLEETKQDTMESINDASNQKAELLRKKSLLDRFGIGGMLDKATNELSGNIHDLEDVKDDVIETMQELARLSQKAGGL